MWNTRTELAAFKQTCRALKRKTELRVTHNMQPSLTPQMDLLAQIALLQYTGKDLRGTSSPRAVYNRLPSSGLEKLKMFHIWMYRVAIFRSNQRRRHARVRKPHNFLS